MLLSVRRLLLWDQLCHLRSTSSADNDIEEIAGLTHPLIANAQLYDLHEISQSV